MKKFWEVLRSPQLVAGIKIAAAVVGVVHAVDFYLALPKKREIGFKK